MNSAQESYNRNDQLSQIENTANWDILIIGGGASGLGAAVDAASRGFKTVLFEQYDFAKGTSSKSTKLVHGGVRYLAQGNIDLVKEALLERGMLAKNARHLFRKQEFIIPNYKWWGTPYYLAGLKIYDLLAKKLSIGPSVSVKKKDLRKRLPTLNPKGLSGGVSYFDGQFDDARLALNLAQTAFNHGATVLNYTKVIAFIKDVNGSIIGVKIEDTETQKMYSILAKVVINATGIFTDTILKLHKPEHKKTVIPSQGIHLMLDRSFLNSEAAIMIPRTSDGRVLFIIPWHNKVIAGTTDTLIKSPNIEPKPLQQEVDFILATVNMYLTKKASRTDVLSVFSGLRPLAKPKDNDTKTKEVSRSHKIIIEDKLVSIVGGKWTTYRKMAEDVMDTIIENYDFKRVKSTTHTLGLYGNIDKHQSMETNHLYIYGSEVERYKTFEQSNSSYQEQLHDAYPYTVGQIVWSVRHEMARTIEDFLSRRIRLLLLDARAAKTIAPAVASIMAEELHRSGAWQEHQIKEFCDLADQYILN